MKRKLLYEFQTTVQAPLETVRQRLPRWREMPDGTLAYQGGWWYRDEYTLVASPNGTVVTYRIFNVASWGRWAVPMANRFFIGFERKTREAFEAGLAGL